MDGWPGDALAAAARATGRPLTALATLRGRSSNSVVRAVADGGPDTVIVKAYGPGQADSWIREATALSLLRGRGLPVPDLIAAVDDPPLVVLEDLGDGPNLADALLGRDAVTATKRLDAWVDALAALHAATAPLAPGAASSGLRSAGSEATRATGEDGAPLAPGPARAERAQRIATPGQRMAMSLVDSMPALLADAADGLVKELPALGLTPGDEALAELRAAAGALDPRASALTPADACPDNNVATADGLVLLDFEHATVRPVAWDAAYLLVPWPSCWCSWALPDEVAEAALARWRSIVARSIPEVGTTAFERDLDLAVVAWAFLSSAWFLPAAIAEPARAERAQRGPAPGPASSGSRSAGSEATRATREDGASVAPEPARAERAQRGPGPTRREVIRHRMGLAARRRSVAPALAGLADAVLAATGERWGDVGLRLAPAYGDPGGVV